MTMYLIMDCCLDCITKIATCISASIACFSFILALVVARYTYNEYKGTRKFEECEVLMKYNERFEQSLAIRRVVGSLFSNGHEKEEQGKTEVDNQEDKVTTDDKELFLRFYEELNHMIECGYIKKEIVANYFAFYFLVAWQDDELFWDSDMYAPFKSAKDAKASESWRSARAFFKKMKDYNRDEVKQFLESKTNTNKKVKVEEANNCYE